jgi:hypothetical protein
MFNKAPPSPAGHAAIDQTAGLRTQPGEWYRFRNYPGW